MSQATHVYIWLSCFQARCHLDKASTQFDFRGIGKCFLGNQYRLPGVCHGNFCVKANGHKFNKLKYELVFFSQGEGEGTNERTNERTLSTEFFRFKIAFQESRAKVQYTITIYIRDSC